MAASPSPSGTPSRNAMTKPLVIYHANCWDGFCAAWVARRFLGEIEAVPAHYGSPPPDVAGRNVYVLDFSYSRDVLLDMHAKAYALLVLDHHATAKAALEGLEFCEFSNEHSGGRMAWDHFANDSEVRPWLVDYTEDRDLWRHSEPFSKEINAALRSHPLSFEGWDDLSESNALLFVAEGQAILRAEKQIVNSHVRNAGRIGLGGYDVPIVNATTLFSEIAGELAKGEPFAVCYFDQQDGKRQWSLRSRDGGVDVSEIAKQYGGGGHKNAAGFETEMPAGSLGATLRHPKGLLTPDDEGELRLAVCARDGNVVIDFGKPVAWLGFPPSDAHALAASISSHANAIDGNYR
jgi:uncharacterized protein